MIEQTPEQPASLSPQARRAELVLHTQSLTYSVTLGMLMLLVPFYLLELGYDFAALGVIIGMQGVFQISLRLFGGVVSDRVGERWVIFAGIGALLAASVLLAATSALLPLVLAQLLIGGSRSVFWTSSQSYGSRILEGASGKFLGRFFGYSSVGGIVGSFLGGFMAGTVGFVVGFGTCAAICLASILLVPVMPDLPRRMGRTIRQILAPVPSVFASRWTVLPAICAFGTSLSIALLGSLLPAYLKVEVGYMESTIGVFRVLHGIGAVVIGFGFSMLLARIGQKAFYAAIVGGNGLTIVLTLLSGDVVWLVGLVMFWMGVAFNAGRVLYAAMTADMTSPSDRGVAMAVTGIYWAAAQLVGPAIFGPLAELIGGWGSLMVAGLFIMAPGLLTPLLYTLFGPGRTTPAPARL